MIKVQEEKQVGVIYHYTSISNLLSILDSNTLKPDRRLRNVSISFTRDRYFHKKSRAIGSVIESRIVLDGNKLSQRYSFEPYSFFRNYYNQESEERVLKRDITDIDKYILRVDLLYSLSTDDLDKDVMKKYFKENTPGDLIDLAECIRDHYGFKCEII